MNTNKVSEQSHAEFQYLNSGIQVGNEANERITDAIASKTALMLGDALNSNFQTLLEAKVSHAVQETIILHAAKSQKVATAFLNQAKTRLAGDLVAKQHEYRMTEIRSNWQLDDLEAFNTDLAPEVQRLADSNGTLIVDTNTASSIGF